MDFFRILQMIGTIAATAQQIGIGGNQDKAHLSTALEVIEAILGIHAASQAPALPGTTAPAAASPTTSTPLPTVTGTSAGVVAPQP